MFFATNFTLLCESLRYFTLFHWKAVLFCQCFVLIGEIFALDRENLALFSEISNFSRKSFRYWKKNCGVSVKVWVIREKFCIITRVFMSFIAWFELLCKILVLLVYAVVLTITRGPKSHISCTWVQCATVLTDWPGRPSCFSDWPAKQKLGRGRWDLSSCQVSSNSVQQFQRRSRKCLSKSEARAAILFFQSARKTQTW